MKTLYLRNVPDDVSERLASLAARDGLSVSELMAEERRRLSSVRRAATTRRAAPVRHGTENGEVTLGGRRVPVERPRVRATDVQRAGSAAPCSLPFRVHPATFLQDDPVRHRGNLRGGVVPQRARVGRGQDGHVLHREGRVASVQVEASDMRSLLWPLQP